MHYTYSSTNYTIHSFIHSCTNSLIFKCNSIQTKTSRQFEREGEDGKILWGKSIEHLSIYWLIRHNKCLRNENVMCDREFRYRYEWFFKFHFHILVCELWFSIVCYRIQMHNKIIIWKCAWYISKNYIENSLKLVWFLLKMNESHPTRNKHTQQIKIIGTIVEEARGNIIFSQRKSKKDRDK